jgi:hypothetical protein
MLKRAAIVPALLALAIASAAEADFLIQTRAVFGGGGSVSPSLPAGVTLVAI